MKNPILPPANPTHKRKVSMERLNKLSSIQIVDKAFSERMKRDLVKHFAGKNVPTLNQKI